MGARALASGGVVAGNEDTNEENPTPADGSEAYVPKMNETRSPLAGVPEVVVAGHSLRVELDVEAEINLATATAYLEPSFGSPVQIGLHQIDTDAYDPDADYDGERSRIWNEDEKESEAVDIVESAIPSFDSSAAFTPDLYDLVVEWEGGPTSPTGGEDRQLRAVSVRESIPETLDVAVIADPQPGDPRGVQSGLEESRTKEDPEPFVQRTRRVSGDRPDERWAATRRAVAEVNALDPDIVLVAGDLCLGQDVPGKFYAEYEDAWEVLNQVRAPTFCTAGNHDAYVQSGTDGKALYRETFGPPSYSDGDARGVEDYPRGTVETNPSGDTVLERTTAGTLYVNVASTMSSTGEYWGYRQFTYDTSEPGLDPAAFRYPMGQDVLDERAVNPDAWDPALDEVGLFSTPSYLLDVRREGSADSAEGRWVTVTNDQAVARSGAVVVSTVVDDLAVEGGTVVWRREAGERTDLKIAFDVAAGGETTVVVRGEGDGGGLLGRPLS